MANQNKAVKGIIGVILLVIGIVMILSWWPDVISLFKGALGILFAIAGLVLLYMLNQ